jgi:hypothetical protein
MADLKGGTTGQVLSKNSNTDMDFVWVTDAAGDITGVTAGTGISGGGTSGTVTVTNSMATAIDAKGDLIAGTGADAFARLAAGSNGETLVADSSTSTGLRWQGSMAAAKNFVINGGFDIWQRGTSFSGAGYTADRWTVTGGTGTTVARSTDTPNSNYTYSASLGGSNFNGIGTRIEAANASKLVGNIATVSFWAKSGTGSNLGLAIDFKSANATDNFSATTTITSAFVTSTTSWVQYRATVTAANMGTAVANGLEVAIYANTGSTGTFLITGVQFEIGSVATTFTRAGGTIQGELAACQRYYYQTVGQYITSASQYLSTLTLLDVKLPVTMRTTPSYTAGTGTIFYTGASQSPTFASNTAGQDSFGLQGTTSSITTGVAQFANLNNDHKFSAEL